MLHRPSLVAFGLLAACAPNPSFAEEAMPTPLPGAAQALPEAEKQPEPEKQREGEPEKKDEPAPETTPGEPAPMVDGKPAGPPRPPITTPRDQPLGAAGPSSVAPGPPPTDHFQPFPDRWRIGFPEWSRYRSGLGAPYKRGRWWDPYRQNRLKGDYPVIGQSIFLDLSLSSDTLVDYRRLPVPSGVSGARPGSAEFFGKGEQLLVDQTFLLSAELFKGDTAFKPKDWSVRITPAFNINRLRTRERGLVNVDVREGSGRINTFAGFQEFFAEYKLFDLSRNYDFMSVRAGIQGFTADFRGHLFVDNQPAIRFFGNSDSNRNQFNFAYFRPLEKDTYSRLIRPFEGRNQDIFILNWYRQDLIRPGYTGQFTVAYNHDHASRHFNRNGLQVRPSLVGDAKPHDVRAVYLGWNGEGHLGRLNISHSFYQALGYDSRNPIAGQSTRINAQFAALEASYDKDWLRFKVAGLYASGDKRPLDGDARGFDAIFDNPIFAGGGFSFWQSQGIRLTGTGLDLVSESSLLPTLRSSKLEGQANFINPGILLLNAGVDAELTPKWRASVNVNWLRFQKTEPLEFILNQGAIRRGIGTDYSIGFRHRPFLNDNVIFSFGASALVPGNGFTDMFSNKTLFSAFARLTLNF